MICFRLLMDVAAYEDGVDANRLRAPILPSSWCTTLAPSDRELRTQLTISRLENLPDIRALLRTGRPSIGFPPVNGASGDAPSITSLHI
jgi:hypothetical protein